MALLNVAVPVLFAPAIAMHCTKTSPLAWNGGMTFFMAGGIFCTQLIIDSICLFFAIRSEPRGGEKIMDIFPHEAPKHGDKMVNAGVD